MNDLYIILSTAIITIVINAFLELMVHLKDFTN
jgi:hypothetical protein